MNYRFKVPYFYSELKNNPYSNNHPWKKMSGHCLAFFYAQNCNRYPPKGKNVFKIGAFISTIPLTNLYKEEN